MTQLASLCVNPVVQAIGKLMRATSKFQVNRQTLQELEDILLELKSRIDT